MRNVFIHHNIDEKCHILQCTQCAALCNYDLVVQGGGRLVHESVGDAIQTLNKKLKVSNIILKGGSSHCRAQDER